VAVILGTVPIALEWEKKRLCEAAGRLRITEAFLSFCFFFSLSGKREKEERKKKLRCQRLKNIGWYGSVPRTCGTSNPSFPRRVFKVRGL
jgi:hypothetical protein